MANGYLTNIQVGDTKPTRRAVIQQWCEAIALAFRSEYGGSQPTSGGYLIDTTPNDSWPTVGCADVAWLKNASQNI